MFVFVFVIFLNLELKNVQQRLSQIQNVVQYVRISRQWIQTYLYRVPYQTEVVFCIQILFKLY